jgi:hypothetical protein
VVSKTQQCVIVVALGAVCGCAGSPYGKQWNNVLVTDDQKVVASCKYIDDFHSWPPYFLPDDDIKNVTKRAAEAGADTVLIKGARIASTEGLAYKCKT